MKHRKSKNRHGPKPDKNARKPVHKTPKAPKLQLDLYGTHAVRAALQNPDRKAHVLYGTENALAQFEGSPSIETVVVQKEALDRALPQGAVHQGLGLSCGSLPEIDLQDLIIQSANKANFTLLILDQVTDPHNVGAILRSACAFGVDGAIMQKKHAPELNGVLAKTACGAIEHVPVAYETNLSRSIEELQASGFFVYGLDERGEDITGVKSFAGKTALVLGAEGPGIRRLVKDHCDGLLRLPMDGPMPSINVSNAAAVALYALSTKN